MYCTHCEIHFSGTRVRKSSTCDCPYCGREAEPSGASLASNAADPIDGNSADGKSVPGEDRLKRIARAELAANRERHANDAPTEAEESPSARLWGDSDGARPLADRRSRPKGFEGSAESKAAGSKAAGPKAEGKSRAPSERASVRVREAVSREAISRGAALKTPAADDSTRTEVGGEFDSGATVAGKYEVVSRLGAGGFGTVYKVRHVYRKKYYPLKTPHPEFARDETFRLRFEREIEAMERFVHSDAVMIRDSGVTESNLPYYTMDFIDGESLKTALRREKRMPIERVLPIIRRVLRVLEVAHAHQIVHRDIKPDNILLTRTSGRETVKVLDFGVAKLLDLVGDTGSVTKGMKVGTPKYMSPEQITGDRVDFRSDLFSLGIVFYELVTGMHPFARVNDPIRVTGAILNREADSPIAAVPELPPVINDHILWMLEKSPNRRPESASAIIKLLGSVEGGVSRVAPIETLEVFEGIRRRQAPPLVLRHETSLGERRSFLQFNEKTTFGRANDHERDVLNDLILRCLPCRSRESDPENWQRNLTISQRLATLYPDGSSVVIEPSTKAKFGIGIGGVRSLRPAKIHSDRFHISLGDKALELDGYRCLRDGEQSQIDLSFLADSRPPEVQAADGVGYSNDACLIDHIRLQRASNWPLHEYFLLYRQLDIGSSANAGLRLRGAGVEAEHARILYEEGEAFLMCLSGRVLIRGSFDRVPSRFRGESQAMASLSVSEFDVPENVLVPLVPGLEIVIGDTVLRVDSGQESHYKTV